MAKGAISKSITSARANLCAKNMTLSTPVDGQSVFLGRNKLGQDCYLKPKCPAVTRGDYLICEMTGYILDHQPPYLALAEKKEIDQQLQDEERNPFYKTEGYYDDERYMSDRTLYSMFTANTTNETFEDINLKLFFAIDEVRRDKLGKEARFSIYSALTTLFKTNVDYTVFKKANKTQITRAFISACLEHYAEGKKPKLYDVCNYRKLNKLKNGILSILKCNDPVPKGRPTLPPQKPVVSRIRAEPEEGVDLEYFDSE